MYNVVSGSMVDMPTEEDNGRFLRNIACRKCEWNMEKAMEYEEKLYKEVETVTMFTYLEDSQGASE